LFANTPIRWHEVPDRQGLTGAGLEFILAAADAAIRERGAFHVVLAGGETPRAIYARLREVKAGWGAWHIYFGDERCLPADNEERNSRMAGDAWLDHVTIPAGQMQPIPAELGAQAAADSYAATLKAVGEFDLVILGLGEDGHTASLFPGRPWGVEVNSPDALAVFDAPKPPPERVSMSAARLSRAQRLLFLVAGESKHQAVADWRAGKLLPVCSITPQSGIDVIIESTLLLPLAASL
jgi:6-phosphogluconolactonase